MADVMWKKGSKSSEEERRKKGQLNLCISGRIGSGCGGRASVSARWLMTADGPRYNPEWRPTQWKCSQWKSSACCPRNLSEVILRSLEEYIDSNDMKLLERKRHLRAPPISSTPKKEEEMISPRKENEKSINGEGRDIGSIESSDAETEEEDEDNIESELQYENKQGEELTEQQFHRMVGKLRGYIDLEDMYALWNYVHTNGKKKYLSLKEELLKDCKNMSARYNIPEEFTVKVWREAYLHFKDEFLKKEREDYMDLKVFIDAGCNVRWEYIAFIIDKYESWDVLMDTAIHDWKKSLSRSFEKYVEDAQEKEIEKNPKTGAKVSCINKYNEENKIMLSGIFL
ncbi:hypothetical protein C922_04679 [Plasmodium inui San Antonio 1]|uniref:Plasmodium RESA N-terminal domain-containing protein n=1 Tax=Plasmodium inui San Antonio 1 TaxID=1237626 RepID=W6ZVY3_9APIC|nr:hypothetical protein C922_04679 [Plasmodium inui San Antonio 1]EUD64947.1 hypothetical protein C922_04679 [Plasmodium inui San Antonio 1]